MVFAFYVMIAVAYGAGIFKHGATFTEAGAAGAAWPFYFAVWCIVKVKQVYDWL